MDFDKISDERLFLNNTKEEIMKWCQNLKYFHYMRARNGHNCDGDSFAVHFKYDGREDLISKLAKLSVELKPLEKGCFSFDPLESYSIEDLDKIRFTIPGMDDVEQPKYETIFGHRVHIWVQPNRFEITIAGGENDNAYRVSDKDFNICLELENQFDQLAWKSYIDIGITEFTQCISKEKYPELYK